MYQVLCLLLGSNDELDAVLLGSSRGDTGQMQL